MTPAQLELLATVDIARPCSMQWKNLTGDDRKRFCGACRQHVYDLTHMTVSDVVALTARAREERVCLRFFRRLDGTVMTKDCEPALLVSRRIVERLVSESGAVWKSTLVMTLLVGVVALGVWASDAYARYLTRSDALGGYNPVTMTTKTFSPRPPPTQVLPHRSSPR